MGQFNQEKKNKKELAILVEYISPHLVLRSESSKVSLKTTWDRVSLRILLGLVQMTQIWLGDPGSRWHLTTIQSTRIWKWQMTAWGGKQEKKTLRY